MAKRKSTKTKNNRLIAALRRTKKAIGFQPCPLKVHGCVDCTYNGFCAASEQASNSDVSANEIMAQLNRYKPRNVSSYGYWWQDDRSGDVIRKRFIDKAIARLSR